MVHGVSPTSRTLVGIDANTGDTVYNSGIPTGDPYAVTVFGATANISDIGIYVSMVIICQYTGCHY